MEPARPFLVALLLLFSDQGWHFTNAQSAGRAAARPGARIGHAMLVDEASNRAIIFGGVTGDIQSPSSDTFFLDLTTEYFSSLQPVDGVRPRGRFAPCSVLYNNSLYIGFGTGENNARFADFWALDLTSHRWRELRTHGALRNLAGDGPVGRPESKCLLFYDQHRDPTIVVTGGRPERLDDSLPVFPMSFLNLRTLRWRHIDPTELVPGTRNGIEAGHDLRTIHRHGHIFHLVNASTAVLGCPVVPPSDWRSG